jgi:hypothetical protein
MEEGRDSIDLIDRANTLFNSQEILLKQKDAQISMLCQQLTALLQITDTNKDDENIRLREVITSLLKKNMDYVVCNREMMEPLVREKDALKLRIKDLENQIKLSPGFEKYLEQGSEKKIELLTQEVNQLKLNQSYEAQVTITTHPDIILLLGDKITCCTKCDIKASAAITHFLEEGAKAGEDDRKVLLDRATTALNQLTLSLIHLKSVTFCIEEKINLLIKEMKNYATPMPAGTLIMCVNK